MSGLTLALGLSMHLGFEGDYNSIHPHVRWEDPYYIAGAYLNSESTISAYVGQEYNYGEFAVELGLVSGYYDIAVAPFIRGKYKNFFIAPAAEAVGDSWNGGIVIGFEKTLTKGKK